MGKLTALIVVAAVTIAACGDTDTSDLDTQIVEQAAEIEALQSEVSALTEERNQAVSDTDAANDELADVVAGRDDALSERDDAQEQLETAQADLDATISELEQLRTRFDPEIQAAIAGAQQQANDTACAAADAHVRDPADTDAPDVDAIVDQVIETLPNGATIDVTAVQARIDECVSVSTQQVAAEALTQPKGNGFHTVGVEMAAGRWRSNGSGDDCYWARTPDGNPDQIIANNFGNDGGTVTVRDGEEFESARCGTWEFLG